MQINHVFVRSLFYYSWYNQTVIKQITVIFACIVKDNQILLTQRDEPECPDAHLKWEFPGGKVDNTETPQESCVREVLEETGLTIETQRILPKAWVTDWEYDWGLQHTILFGYVCKPISGDLHHKDHHVRRVEWFDIDKVKDLPTLPAVNDIIETVKKELL